MSQLRDTLDRISNWLQTHSSREIRLRPGLSLEQIQVLTNDLPIKLPNEVYELYQWRNGCYSDSEQPLPSGSFLPLEEVISQYHDDREYDYAYDEEERQRRMQELIIIIKTNGWYFVNCKEDEHGNYPVGIHEQGFGNYPTFQNLTQMMSTILECYETNVFCIDSNGYLDANWKKWNSILKGFQDSNSDTINHDDVEAKHLLRRWYEVITDWFSFFSRIK